MGNGKDVIQIRLPRNSYITSILFPFLALRQTMKFQPTICLIEQYWAEFTGLLLKTPWIPIISDVGLFQSKRMQQQHLRHFIRVKVLKKVMQKAKRIIVHWDASASDLQKHLNVPPNKICVIKVGTYLNNFSIHHKGIHILCVGKIVPFKAQHIVLQAFRDIKKKHSMSKLFLVGEIPHQNQEYYKLLLSMIETHHIKDVYFTGNVDEKELEKHYASADICVQPALDMLTGGLAVIEAFSHQKPVISAESLQRFGIVDKDRALLIQNNSAKVLAKNIELLIEKEDLRSKLAQNGYDFAKGFSWEITAEKVEKAIRNLGMETK